MGVIKQPLRLEVRNHWSLNVLLGRLEMSKLSAHQQVILKTLLESGTAITTSEVMKKTGLAWQTCKKILDEFEKDQWIERITKGNRNYWRAEPPQEGKK